MHVAALTGSVGRLPGVARGDAVQTVVPAAPEKPQEPYFSPVFRFDKQARVLVFQFRDSETGNVTRQYPSEKVVQLYRDNAPKDAQATTPVAASGSEEAADPVSSAVKTSGGGGSTESSGASEPAKTAGGTAGTDRVRVTV
jgi:hypothetical protein